MAGDREMSLESNADKSRMVGWGSTEDLGRHDKDLEFCSGI